jgi:hypothetical protein
VDEAATTLQSATGEDGGKGMSTKHEFEYIAWVVTDSFGNTYRGLVAESSDTVQVCGMKSPAGDQYFESEYYHLSTWCMEHGFVLRYKKGVLRLDDSEMDILE